MVKDKTFEDYEPDVQKYLISEAEAAKIPMYKGEYYTNSLGIGYRVLEDSPAGNVYVRVKCNFVYGGALREIPKILLIS